MELTILHVGETPFVLRDRYGRFPPLFQEMFAAVGAEFSYREVHVLDGAPLPDPETVEGVVITGSALGVYDEAPWIEPLRAFLRAAYGARTKLVGVCFGHQIMADALGGTVEKSGKGWGLGRQEYRLLGAASLFPEGTEGLAVPASHQDQVIVPPREAEVFLGSDFTPNAGLVYRNGAAISVQPHPEFTPDLAAGIVGLRRNNPLDESVVDEAVRGLSAPLDNGLLAKALATFLKSQG